MLQEVLYDAFEIFNRGGGAGVRASALFMAWGQGKLTFF